MINAIQFILNTQLIYNANAHVEQWTKHEIFGLLHIFYVPLNF